MKYTAEDIIREVYDTNPEYQIYSLEEFTEIALAPLAFFKNHMKTLAFPSMRFTHMGLFIVFPGAVAKMLHYNQERFNKGVITQETYEAFKAEMEEVHERLVNRNKKRGKLDIIYLDEDATVDSPLQEQQA